MRETVLLQESVTPAVPLRIVLGKPKPRRWARRASSRALRNRLTWTLHVRDDQKVFEETSMFLVGSLVLEGSAASRTFIATTDLEISLKSWLAQVEKSAFAYFSSYPAFTLDSIGFEGHSVHRDRISWLEKLGDRLDSYAGMWLAIGDCGILAVEDSARKALEVARAAGEKDPLLHHVPDAGRVGGFGL